MIWRGAEGEDREERRMYVEWVMERVMGRRMSVRGVEERRGEEGKWVLIMEMGCKRDRSEVLDRGVEIRRKWGIGVDEDL